MEETAPHLLTYCNFSKAVWNIIAPKYGLPLFSIMCALEGPLEWMNFCLSLAPPKKRERRLESYLPSGALFGKKEIEDFFGPKSHLLMLWRSSFRKQFGSII
jgi:hypothetical protein